MLIRRRCGFAGRYLRAPKAMCLVALACWLGACGAAEASPTPTPIPFTGAPSALLLTPLPTGAPSPPNVITTVTPRLALETTTAALSAMGSALNDPEPGSLILLLADQVLITNNRNGEGGSILSHADASRWLAQHWGTTRTLVRTQYVEQFVLLIVDTKDWATATPLKQGTLTFQLHRYNVRGQGDPMQGFWEIDTIIYQ